MFRTLFTALIALTTFTAFAQDAGFVWQPVFFEKHGVVRPVVAPPPLGVFGDWVEDTDGNLTWDETAVPVARNAKVEVVIPMTQTADTIVSGPQVDLPMGVVRVPVATLPPPMGVFGDWVLVHNGRGTKLVWDETAQRVPLNK
jgi:hypothetical protein